MFDNNSTQIIKVDGKGVFIDFRSCFEIDKIVMQFRRYDNNAAAGSKITESIDFYMDLEDFAYFSYCLYSGGIQKIVSGSGYTAYGGSKDKNNPNLVVSRVLRIEGGKDDKYFIKAQSGPGKKTATGAIMPDYKNKRPDKEIVLCLNTEQLKKIGLSGERAIRIRDMWYALGVLDQKNESLRFKSKNTASRPGNVIPYSTDSTAPEMF